MAFQSRAAAMLILATAGRRSLHCSSAFTTRSTISSTRRCIGTFHRLGASLPYAAVDLLLSVSPPMRGSRPNPTSSRSSIARRMTTAYGGEPGDGKAGLSSLPWIPYTAKLPSGRTVEVDSFREPEWSAGMDLMNLIIREGKSWPFDSEFETVDAYRGYFLSHAAFVVRAVDHGLDNRGRMSRAGDVLGCFYVKPNYPGRCSHICNGGFITDPAYRQMGVAKLMGQVFLRAARDLGYKSAYFNLVFKSNGASVALWESLGFKRVAVLEKAAKLEGVDGLDTAYGYRFDLETLDDDYLLNGSS